ncbi:MAG: neutral/alkaline non-lysosomal ceramidase N-terminal domain-containing protein [Gemmataceae bacterium]
MQYQPLVVGLLFSVAGLASGAEGLRAGAAKVDITPPTGYAMWGYASRHDQPSAGVLDRLHARALVLQMGKEKIALVSLDLGRPPTRKSMMEIVKRIDDTGIAWPFLVASHTHHGPVIELDNWPTPQNSYVRQLEEKISACIIEADKQLRPARLGVAAKQVPYNRNRHSRLPDKPVDQELLVLRVDDANGKPIAHAVNFAAHPTMLPRTLMKFSADYPGALAELVEKETGAPCLFLQGACGDLSPNPGEHAGPEKFGQLLGRETLALSQTISCQECDKPTWQGSVHDFSLDCRIDHANPLLQAALSAAFFPELISFYEREYQGGRINPEMTVGLLNGDIGFVGVSGEFFCGHSLSLKRRARVKHLFFLGYCNNYHQYFPTIEAAAEGGYGTDPFGAPASVGAGEELMNTALIQLYKFRGRLPDLRGR